jgi:hypothetical protein
MSMPPILIGKIHCQHMSVIGLNTSALQTAQETFAPKTRMEKKMQQKRRKLAGMSRRTRLFLDIGKLAMYSTSMNSPFKKASLSEKHRDDLYRYYFSKRRDGQIE